MGNIWKCEIVLVDCIVPKWFGRKNFAKMNNYSIRKNNLAEINLKFIKEAIFACYKDGITSMAPLGFSGDTIVLYEGEKNGKTGRVSQVSIRNYCNDAELLITDKIGNFLFYGRFDVNLGVSFLASFYFNIFKKVEKYIETELPNVSDFTKVKIPKNVKRTIGFDMIRAYQTQHGNFFAE